MEAKLSTEMADTENSKLVNSKRDGIRKSIFTLCNDWKDLEENLDSTEKNFEKRIFELGEREDDLKSILKSVKEELKNSEESHRQELEKMEAKFSLNQQKQTEHLRTKEKSVDDMLDKTSKSFKEKTNAVVLREEKVRLKENELESAKELIDRRSVEFDKKEADYKFRSIELNTLQNLIEKRLDEVGDKEKEFEVRWNELLEKEKEVELQKKKFQELDSVQVSIDKSLEEISLEKEGLEKKIECINVKTSELVEKSNEAEETCKSLEEKTKEVELEKRRIKKWKRNFQLKEKMLMKNINSHVKIEKVDGMPANIRLYVTMEGKDLQLFLNENANHHGSICEENEVLRMIQLSTDPTMLILDAMEGFYPPHLSKGDKTFETSVVMKSCILLLQQLGKISPMIQSKAKERALELSEEWKKKINLTACNPLEVFALLHLLASYGLAADCGADIIKFIELVAENDQVFELCRLPGFADKIPVLIKRFIRQSRFVVAVKFICNLDLAEKFPPVPLLKSHIKLWRNIAINTVKNSKDLKEGQNKAIDERLSSLREVLNCISEFNLQSQYPPTTIEIAIEQMLKRKKSGKISNDYDPSDKVKLDTLVDTDRPSDNILTRILANMNGKSLLQFLSKHLSEIELMKNDVSKVLKRLSDPGEFVIVAIKKLHSVKRSNIMRSFLYVLELLAGIPFEIEISVLEAAIEVAVDWKVNLSLKDNPVHILAFLQLVFTYKLTPGYDSNELYNLCCSVSDCKELPGLSEILALSEKVPVSKILNYEHKITQSGSKRAPLNSVAVATNPDLRQLSSDPAKLLFDAMQCCYLSNLKDVKGAETTMSIFVSVLKEVVNVPLNISPEIQAKASGFATDWKKKLVKKTSKNQEVLCFLLFLSVYKLASLFDCDEILYVLNFYENNFSINLLHDLNLDKRMPKFIKNLIAREKKLNALICIYSFNQINDFPPVPILKSYLASEGEACDKDHNPEEVGMSVVDEEITALRAVINRISKRGLILPNDFNRRLKTLLAQNKADGENVPSVSQSQKQPEDARIIVPPPSPITDNTKKEENDKKEDTKVTPSKSSKKRRASSPTPRCSKRKAAPSAAAATTTETAAASSSRSARSARSHTQPPSTMVQCRPPSRSYVPIETVTPSFTYFRDQNRHIPPPNNQMWQYGQGMTPLTLPYPLQHPIPFPLSVSLPPHLPHRNANHSHSFAGRNNSDYNGPPLRYEWPNQNHHNFNGRRY